MHFPKTIVPVFILIAHFFVSAAAYGLDWYKIADIDAADATMGLEFHNDQLWVSRIGDSTRSHRIEVRDAEGKNIIKTLNFPHSVSYFYPISASEVIVVGKAYTSEWFTFYSTVTKRGGSYSIKTTRIQSRYQINEFAKIGNQYYFTEPGSRSVLKKVGSRIQTLPFEISFPSQLLELDRNIWLLEKRGPGPGDESLVKIDLRSNRASRVGAIKGQYGPYNLRKLADGRLVMDDRLNNKFIVFDAKAGEVSQTIALDHTPMSIAVFKNCAILPGGADKKISVVRIGAKESKIIASFDLSGIAGEFNNAIRTAVNPSKGLIYVKSMYPCMTCGESQSALYAISTPDLKWQNECK